MSRTLLVLNAGSSSLKFTLYRAASAADLIVLEHDVVELAQPDPAAAAEQIMTRVDARVGIASLAAVAHRVVHGGDAFVEPLRIDADVLAKLQALVPLAPLHQPQSVAAMRSVAGRWPQMTQIACFDTAFHHNQPKVARLFGLPFAMSEQGIVSYGFHGLSYEFIATAMLQLAPPSQLAKLIVAHLGNGASLCAIRDGRSVATTMSFTPLDGIPMGTRPGAIDPGVLLYLLQQNNFDAAKLEKLLYRESGLLGVSGVSADMRELLASSEPRAQLAIELFVYRIVCAIGSLAATLQGIDALVFTGGIGEHAAPIRAAVCRAIAWLGVQIDDNANRAARQRISTPDSRVSAWVMPTDENLMIARHAVRLLDEVGTARVAP